MGTTADRYQTPNLGAIGSNSVVCASYLHI